MCQPSSSSQIKTGPIFAPALNMHFALGPPSQSRQKQADKKRCAPPISLSAKKQKTLGASLHFHEVYLKIRLANAPGYVSTKQLLKEITDRGYRGKLRTLQRFLSIIRTKPPKEASLQFHKDYLSKKIENLGFDRVVAKRLFEEIRAKGYQGTYQAVRVFLATMCIKPPEEASLKFHKNYLIKRMQESKSERGVIKQLFEEVKAKGYQGTYKTVRTFLAMVRTNEPKEISLKFHKEYLIKRMKESKSELGIGKQLFREIKAKGYQGALTTVQRFLRQICEEQKVKKTSLETDKEYPKKKVEEAAPNSVSTSQPFQEISDPNVLFDDVVEKDFLHSPFFSPLHSINPLCKTSIYQNDKDCRDFFTLSPALMGCNEPPCKEIETQNNQEKLPEACLEFHIDYLKKRLEETAPKYASAKQLFEEISAKGYRGAFSTMRSSLSVMRNKKEELPQASLDFHKDYLQKRIKKNFPKRVPSSQLFKEITARGYKGKFRPVQTLASMIYKEEKNNNSKEFLHFHEAYLQKRVDEDLQGHISTKQLFKEIKDRGYQGKIGLLELFLAILRKRRDVSSEKFLDFHKDYLQKRINETEPYRVSAQQLFKEITNRGYRGKIRMLQLFLATIRKSNGVPSKNSLELYKNYLTKRVEETYPDRIPFVQLFEEVKARGYRGTVTAIRCFLWRAQNKKKMESNR